MVGICVCVWQECGRGCREECFCVGVESGEEGRDVDAVEAVMKGNKEE